MHVCGSHVIDEPDQRHDEQTEPVELDDEPVRRLDLRHAVLLGLLRLVQAEPQEEQRKRRDDSEAQTDAPVCAQVVLAEDPQEYERHKGADDEADVDHQVGEEDEPAVARALFDLARCFGGRDGAGGVFAADTDACGVLGGEALGGGQVSGAHRGRNDI